MIVAVGSLRGPKVDAVRRALARLSPIRAALGQAQVVARDVSRWAPRMPLTLEALLEGARARAVAALGGADDVSRADLGVGLEGGLDIRVIDGGRRGFLMSWAHATDGRRGSFGCGGGIELPAELLETVADHGVELGEAIDRFAGEVDVRSRQGAWGVLTRGVVERSASFETAVVSALAPWYNEEAYR